MGSESCIVDEDLVQGSCEIVQGTSVSPYRQNLQSLEQAVSRMSVASVTMGGSQPYLAMGPKGLLESCDVLLKLDGGSELPAHSQVLARCMSVVSDMMVAGGPLAKASAENVVRVPFGECLLEEASRFLSAIYSSRASEHIDEGSALSIARLSHKYGGEVRSSQIGLIIYVHVYSLASRVVLNMLQSARRIFSRCATSTLRKGLAFT